MKVITKVVVDIETMQIVEQTWFNYEGPALLCKGGGSSGTIDYPTYMKDIHNNWLDNTGVDTLSTSITDSMETAIGGSPFLALNAYDPDDNIIASQAAINLFSSVLSGVVVPSDWAVLFSQASTSLGVVSGLSEAAMAAEVAAFGDMLDDEINTKVLPRFRRGMQDINAVNSSAFVIGEAVIESFRGRDVAKYAADLRVRGDLEYKKMFLDSTAQLLQFKLQHISWHEGYARLTAEHNRIAIVAKKEEFDVNAEIDEKDALWDLTVFQHGGNLLAAIGGGTSGTKGPSRAQSAIGGALSGAASGAMIGMSVGGPTGAAVGAGVGAIAGLASGLL